MMRRGNIGNEYGERAAKRVREEGEEHWVVTPGVELVPEWGRGSAEGARAPVLDAAQIDLVRRQALARLEAVNPLLPFALEVKVVCNPRRNFINLVVRREYVTLCFHTVDRATATVFCYFLSDKLEPFVIVTALPAHGCAAAREGRDGRLARLTVAQTHALDRSVAEFRRRYRLEGESYHYTGFAERREDSAFARASGALGMGCKAHSSNWHLKIRVPTSMCAAYLNIWKLLSISDLRTTVEPVKYNFTRETLPWKTVFEQLLNDAIPDPVGSTATYSVPPVVPSSEVSVSAPVSAPSDAPIPSDVSDDISDDEVPAVPPSDERNDDENGQRNPENQSAQDASESGL